MARGSWRLGSEFGARPLEADRGHRRRLLDAIGGGRRKPVEATDATGGCWRSLEDAGGSWRLLEAASCLGLLGIPATGRCWRLLAAAGDCWKLLEAAERLLETVGGSWRFLEAARLLEAVGG